jgi:hypothetical protein
MYEKGKQFNEELKKKSINSLDIKPPTESESKILHDKYIEYKKIMNNEIKFNKKYIYPKNYEKKTILYMVLFIIKSKHPQEKNLNNKIFGGYLIKSSFEVFYNH